MTQSAGERKQTTQELVHLVPVNEWSKCKTKDQSDPKSKLDTLAEADSEP